MGYGFGGFITAIGLILALAVKDSVDAVDLTMIGWILTGVGVAVLLFTVFTLNNSKRHKTTQTVTHPDGSQTVKEQDTI